VYGAGAGRYNAAASTSSCVYLMFITIAVNWFAADCNLIRGFVMIRLLMRIVPVMKERKICLTVFLQFVILSPPVHKSSHLPMSSLATKWYWNELYVYLLWDSPWRSTKPDWYCRSSDCMECYLSFSNCRSQRPRGLWRGSAAARLLELWVRIPPGHGCLSLLKCCVLSGCLFASGWSHDRRNPTECGVSSECDREAS
jgi:hypothetical protein